MARPSTIQRLPAELRDLIGELRERGRTIDEILSKLRELDVDVSRSALGRHVKQIDAIGSEIRRSRAVAESLVRQYGEAPESRTARLNIELMQGLVTRLMFAEDGEAIQFEPKDAMMLATALQKLAQAAKQDADREVLIRKEFAKKLDDAIAAAEEAGERGLSLERLAELRRGFLGVGRAS